MDASFFQRAPKRHIQDLNIVPILDMLTTVIFFLLLSTSFMEYTKLSLPPSKTSVITDPVAPPPLGTKFLLVPVKEEFKAVLFWAGAEPGEFTKMIPLEKDPDLRRKAILKTSKEMADEFLKKYPKEKTIQLGLGSQVSYQDMVSLMDGVRDVFPDIVLISPAEAEARVWKSL